jgi:hypothetical protein
LTGVRIDNAASRRGCGRGRPSLDLPPAYTLVTLHEAGDAFAHACQVAGKAGAGTLVWARRFDLVEFAVVLEPAQPLVSARRAFFAGMVALADAVASICLPEKRISFDWPDAIGCDGARLGGGRLGWPGGCHDEDVPPWLVFSAMLIASKQGAGEPGLTPGSTSLEEEACEIGDHGILIESFARYLMRAFDIWAERGFDAVAETYLARLAQPRVGYVLKIEENGDLVAAPQRSGTGRLAFLPALKAAVWLDSKTGKPLL